MNDRPAIARKNRRTGLVLLAVILGMLGLSFAAVPFYRVFCRATGFGGTTGTARAAPVASQILNRTVTVKFNSAVAPGMPWRFAPQQREVDVRIGAKTLVAFNATNLSDQTVAGAAVYNVTPEKVGRYFRKIQCFCFSEQVLKAHESVSMPVLFFVDPAFDKDPEMEGVSTITLSYTFFNENAAKPGLDRTPEASYNASSANGLSRQP